MILFSDDLAALIIRETIENLKDEIQRAIANMRWFKLNNIQLEKTLDQFYSKNYQKAPPGLADKLETLWLALQTF